MRKAALTGWLLALMLAASARAEGPPHQAAPDRPLKNPAEEFVFGKVERYFHWRYAHGNVDSYFIPRCGPVKCVASVSYNQGPNGDLMTVEACWVRRAAVNCRIRQSQEWLAF